FKKKIPKTNLGNNFGGLVFFYNKKEINLNRLYVFKIFLYWLVIRYFVYCSADVFYFLKLVYYLFDRKNCKGPQRGGFFVLLVGRVRAAPPAKTAGGAALT
ncbi:hypothetical protein, partial [Enterobacter intestinihominis]